MKPKKLLSFILMAATTLSFLPTFTITASAATATTEKNITLGTSALSGYDSTNGYKYVYYGTYDSSPIKWRILSMNGNDGTYYEAAPYTPTQAPNDSEDGKVYTDSDETTKFIYLAKSGKYYKQTTSNPMFLLSEYALKQMPYDADGSANENQIKACNWRYSDVWNWCNNISNADSFIYSSFVSDERNYLLKTSKSNGYYGDYTDELKGDTFFLLSSNEIQKDYIKNNRNATLTSGVAVGWWLRSPAPNLPGGDWVKVVTGANNTPTLVNEVSPAIRPAFNLDLSSVLFTSAANGGKASTIANGGKTVILKNADYTISGDEKYEYKLTMLDTDRDFEVTQTTVSGAKGETITLNYENAEKGSNEYISAMIVDETDGQVLYYGQIKNVTDSDYESRTVDFKIPSDIDLGTYELRLFNEQINGDYKTDYSSAFETVTLSVEKPKATFTTEPTAKTLTYNCGNQDLTAKGISSEGTVKYSLTKDGAYTTDIPTGKNAGTYTVWYYIEGDDDHTDSDIKNIEVTISQKDIADTSITLGNMLTYNGTSQTQTISITDSGTVLKGQMFNSEIELDLSRDYTVYSYTGTNASDYYLKIKGNGNYTATVYFPFKIAKANSFVTTAPTKAENLAYTGDELTLLTADGAALGGTIKYSIDGENFIYDFADIPKVKNADDYKIWYKVIGDANHNDTAAICNEIKVAEKPINTAITLAAPIKNATPQTTIETDEYTATVLWSPTVDTNGTFAKSTEYTATITVTPKANYTTDGITENGYTLDGATSVTNAADSNVVTAVFPKTAGNSGSGNSGSGNSGSGNSGSGSSGGGNSGGGNSGGGSSGGGSSVTRYTVKFDTNGGSTITSQTVKKNSAATEPTEPTKEGYIFDGWYSDSKFTTEYDFDTKVTKNITLYAKWVEDEIQEPSDDKKDSEQNSNDDNTGYDEQKPDTNEWKNPFTDVLESDWFFDNVKYANQNGLMSGTTNTTFAPDETLTRGMLVTVLYRTEGEPAVNKSIPFVDVAADSYYANAVIWAAQNGIVKGITETEFAPDENITREQIATIIYRYANYKGYDMSVGEDTNILSYTDFKDISEYATEAMQYAVGSGLMKGKTESTLNPKDFATRAEIAAILNRFIEGNK